MVDQVILWTSMRNVTPMEYNGKHVDRFNLLENRKKLQKVWSPNLKRAFEKVDGATVPPEKTLLNVGLNDSDVSESAEIIETLRNSS